MPTRYFCTYFDSHYLTRGLALIESLTRHCPAYRLWVLCFDEPCYEKLAALKHPHVTPIRLSEFEAGDAALVAAKGTRSRVEYFFTCTPSLPLFVLRTAPEVDVINYLDADLFFYHSPEPLFQEFAARSIGIIAHRFAPAVAAVQFCGIYNVGMVIFRRDAEGMRCLEWWRERCIEWCYQRPEAGRYGDQKYLDDWPTRFRGVAVLEHKGANVAVWNLANHPVTRRESIVMIGDQPLIFYHFHGLKQNRTWLYDLNTGAYGVVPNNVVLDEIYAPYLSALHRLGGEVPSVNALRAPLIDALSQEERSADAVNRLRYRKRKIFAAWHNLTQRRKIVVQRGRILRLPVQPSPCYQ